MTNCGSLDHLNLERTRAESMLRMLEGNTHPDDLKRLRKEWLEPILDRLEDRRNEAVVKSE